MANIARILAEVGETVHVIGERWAGAPLEREERCDGRLVIHRVGVDDEIAGTPARAGPDELQLLGPTTFPAQRFAWRAALLAESLVRHGGIDVIEGQDWEAPLYYLLGRRALGLGPEHGPPCVVHLHTPTEFIFRLNEWRPHRPEQLATIRMEEYCITAADALVCPSQYMARQIATRYAVPLDAIAVIPYPLGDFPLVDRGDAVWRDGPFVYVGRLEPRKGLLEFVDAAVDVAKTHDQVSFDFVGDDGWYRGRQTMQQYMAGRIPRGLRERFRFHGVQPRSRLPEILGRARAAVIPSRGENYPNVCIEAMCSGLPVIASPTGGMVEMLDDGVTGWIASSQSAHGLAEALRRALATPAEKFAAMGRAAAIAIRQRCRNDIIVRQQLTWRKGVVESGAARSIGMSRPGVAVPAFTPVTYAPELSVRDILRLPMRDKASLAVRALRHPARALAWLRSVLTPP